MEEGCLDWVSLFMREDCPYELVLSSLFHLVSHSTKVARSLKMSEVWSSDLETGLSLSDDRVILEATSPSTPYKAWKFLDLVKIRIPSDKERACHSYADEICFYEADFTSGLRFPVYPFVRELFSYLHLALTQLVPSSWRIIVSCMVVWIFASDGDVIKRNEFLYFYRLRKSKDPGYYEFKLWDRASRLILNYPSSLRNWKPNFFFVFGSGWELIPGKDLDEYPKFFHSWGVPVPGVSFSSLCCFSFLL